MKNLFFVLCIIFFGCDTGPDSLDPISEAPISYVSLDVKLPVATLAAAFNGRLVSDLYSGSIGINKRDTLFVNIKRARPFDLSYADHKLKIIGPVEVSAVIKKKVLGLTISNAANPLRFRATVKLHSELSLDENWDLEIPCTWEGIHWESEPIFNLLGLRINLSNLIEKQLNKNKSVIETMLSRRFQSRLRLSPVLDEIYKKMQTSLPISNQSIPLYLQTVPTNIRGKLLPATDTLQLHVEQQMQMTISPRPEAKVPNDLPRRRDPLNNQSSLSSFIDLRMPFDDLERILKEYASQKPLVFDDYTMDISKINITNEQGRLKFDLAIKGDLDMHLVAVATPTLDDNLVFGLTSLQYELLEADQVTKVADIALHGAIEKYMLDALQLDVSLFFDSFAERIQEGVAMGKAGDKINLDLELSNYQLYGRGIDHKELQFILQFEGNGGILLQSQALVKNTK